MEILKIIMRRQKLFLGKFLAEFKGTELEGFEYEQLLPFDANS